MVPGVTQHLGLETFMGECSAAGMSIHDKAVLDACACVLRARSCKCCLRHSLYELLLGAIYESNTWSVCSSIELKIHVLC